MEAVQTLSPRHRLIALALAAGKPAVEIAASFGMTPVRIAQLKQSPLFQALVEEEQAHLRDQIVESTIERLNGEADRTLDRMIELRDQDRDLGVAARMTDSMADRIPTFPKKATADAGRAETPALRFDRDDVVQMIGFLAEARGVPAPTRVIPATVSPTVHVGLTFDEALEKLPA